MIENNKDFIQAPLVFPSENNPENVTGSAPNPYHETLMNRENDVYNPEDTLPEAQKNRLKVLRDEIDRRADLGLPIKNQQDEIEVILSVLKLKG